MVRCRTIEDLYENKKYSTDHTHRKSSLWPIVYRLPRGLLIMCTIRILCSFCWIIEFFELLILFWCMRMYYPSSSATIFVLKHSKYWIYKNEIKKICLNWFNRRYFYCVFHVVTLLERCRTNKIHCLNVITKSTKSSSCRQTFVNQIYAAIEN